MADVAVFAGFSYIYAVTIRSAAGGLSMSADIRPSAESDDHVHNPNVRAREWRTRPPFPGDAA